MSLTDLLLEWTAIHEARIGKPMPLLPASEAEIAELEELFELRFTDELRELLAFTHSTVPGWSGNPNGHMYFPGGVYANIRQWAQVLPELATTLEADSGPFLDVPGAGQKSAQLLTDAGILVGIVCEGPAEGALWHWNSDGATWITRSLSEFVGYCIEYEHNGYLDWEQRGPLGGCEVARPVPREPWVGQFPREVGRSGLAWSWEPLGNL